MEGRQLYRSAEIIWCEFLGPFQVGRQIRLYAKVVLEELTTRLPATDTELQGLQLWVQTWYGYRGRRWSHS